MKTTFQISNAVKSSRVLQSAIALALVVLGATSSKGGSATWKQNPATGDWNTASNWMPATVPNGPIDTATFATSNKTAISIAANIEVNGIVFNPSASAFTITTGASAMLTISGAGITSNSTNTETFVDSSGSGLSTTFTGNATVGSGISFTCNHVVIFQDTSSAGAGVFTVNGALLFEAASSAGQANVTVTGVGEADFRDSSNAGDSTLMLTEGGSFFSGSASAADATITVESFAFLIFEEFSTPDNATIIVHGGDTGDNGGVVKFFDSAGRNSTAPVEVFGNGSVDISGQRSQAGVKLGSIEGDGLIFLGGERLTVGSNNLNTVFSGVIQDEGGGFGGTGGSLVKIRNGTLALSNVNTYTGGTTIEGGSLLVATQTGSATGTGPVQVNAGTFGGRSNIGGAVTIGSGTGPGAFLAPGGKGAGKLAIKKTLNVKADGNYNCDLSTISAKADQVTANGVTIESGAHFVFQGKGTQTLPPGTVFTVINNKSANAISGTFINLTDGSTFTANGNNFQVNYEGGDGNDLTLTVVP